MSVTPLQRHATSLLVSHIRQQCFTAAATTIDKYTMTIQIEQIKTTANLHKKQSYFIYIYIDKLIAVVINNM